MRDLLRRARLRFWLWTMDIVCATCGYGSQAYLWALERAADADDWGEPLEPEREERS